MSSTQPEQTPTRTSTSIPSSSTPPILLLKTKSTPHDGYEEFFSAHGYRPAFVPVLEHRFRDDNLHRVKRDIFHEGDDTESTRAPKRGAHRNKKYGGLIFTSQRAVEAFARLVEREVEKSSAINVSHSLVLYTVGPATARTLKTLRDIYLPHAEIYGADAGNGENLARMILRHYNAKYINNTQDDGVVNPQEGKAELTGDGEGGGGRKLPLLFLVGDQRRDIIPKILMTDPGLSEREKIVVEEVVVYETGVMESFERDFGLAVEQGREWLKSLQQDPLRPGVEEEQDMKNMRMVVWVVVFSPTGCDAMLRVLGRLTPSPPPLPLSDNTGPALENEHRRICIATIGPTTRDHLRSKYGVEPDVCAETPSPEGLGRGIEEYTALQLQVSKTG